MKIITILLLMISTQAQAISMANTAEGGITSFTVEQCNQIANVSKRTIKAATSGVPIAEVINKFTQGARPHQTGEALLLPAVQAVGVPVPHDLSKQQADEYKDSSAGAAIELANKITAIYKTVNQIKTKYGQVRPQDRVRLNNRVEQKLLECREMANNLYGTPSSEISVEGVVVLPYPRCL